MTFLVFGLVLFFAVHLLPLSQQREVLVARLGRGAYLGLFSALSLAGLLLMIHGYRQSDPVQLWIPVSFARPLAHVLMPFAFVLLVSAYLPGKLRRWLRHPMLLATLIWAGVHLLANGDLASTLIFAAFLVYALVDIVFSRPRQTLVPQGEPRVLFDLLALLVGLLGYFAVMFGHQALFGVTVI
ncbi:NnrU family protein [Marinobacterium arenosum]|uniref:NnrU family protein n=1 Tax=Marinobacterium arenosum TaxID=2862496 RepID=UPI001C977F24|nr:NnrU family protein [Marinobacterium arenosum]MBY4677162.1 NnrU family protein [Marinobacterium arenosum]